MKHTFELTKNRFASLLAGALAIANAGAATINVPASADTFIINGLSDNNAGGAGLIDVGSDGSVRARRTLIQFDLSSVPAGATVTSASLRLQITMVPAQSAAASTIDLFRLNAGWGEGAQVGNAGALAQPGEATWNRRGLALWTTPGAAADAVTASSGSAAVTSTIGDTITWSGPGLVADLAHWLANPTQNFGWLMVSQQEGSSRSVRAFGSRETAGAAPVLQIEYTATGGNTPPSVAIDSPAGGAVFNEPANVTINATASDTDGTVTQVQFFNGTTSLGADTTSPYSVMASLAFGSHALTAVATDNGGAMSTSAVVNVSVVATNFANPIVARIPKGDVTIELKPIADGMVSPLGMAVPDDGSGRMFVYDQVGVIWVVTSGGRSPTPLLDLRTRIMNLGGGYDERGLLGVAVHPNFAANPLIYTYTSEPNAGTADFASVLPQGATNNHQSVIAEWRLNPASANTVDPATRREVIRIDQPQSNHNGGTMRFGPDGFLYFTLGDGGQANDVGNGHSPGGNGQDTTNILGSLVRIDVDGRTSPNGQYGVPGNNPFVGAPGVDEIFAYGLRNPFSFSFDRANGQIFLADVGQNQIEEIDVIISGGNYGWNIKEGSYFFSTNGAYVTNTTTRPVPPNLIDPIAEYDHDDGTAVVGGYVYRGSALPSLAGKYVFGDWGTFSAPSGRLYYLDTGNVIKEFRIGTDDRPLAYYLKGFGEDAAGELYVFASKTGPSTGSGVMYKIVEAPASAVAITGVSVTNGTNFVTAWTGGVGPFAVQRKLRLDEPFYTIETITNGNSTVARMRGPTGFFRTADTAQQPPVPFTALLNGANERPNPVSTTATGFGIFKLSGNTLQFAISYEGLTGNATAAHIHGPAPASGSGGVLINLQPFHTGAFGTRGSFSGAIVLTDAQKAVVMAGRTYVNIHTGANGDGEIRGQVAPVLMQASLLDGYEPGNVNTGARGFGSFTLIGNQLSFNIGYADLGGPAGAAHIHGPAGPDASTGVLVDLSPFHGGSFGSMGMLSGSTNLTAAQLAAVIDGQTYVNFHTTQHGTGELRGQVMPQVTAIPFTAWISGTNERPTALVNDATGLGYFSLEGNKLAFNIMYAGLSGAPTGAHIHGAAASSGSAGIQIDLAPYAHGALGVSGRFSGTVVLTPAQRTMLLAGQTYFNIHTSQNTGGEARGNIAPVLMTALATGTAERPTSVASSGSALGLFTLAGRQLNFNVVYGGLSGAASGAHIHGPSTVQATGPIVIDFAPFNGGAYGAAGVVSGSTNLPPAVLNALIDGLGYINFHTTQSSSGEIRGQINR